MSPKSIAFLIVGMVLISGVFVFFHVDYPSAPAQIIIKPPKGYTPPVIYQKEIYNNRNLGGGNTSFKDYGNSTVVMQGYARNSSNGSPIGNATLYSAVLEAGTVVQTSSNGFYRIVFLQSGYGKFAFKIFQYNTLYTENYLPVNATVWNNLSFVPSPKYTVSGTTVYNGSTVGNVMLNFASKWGTYNTSSSSAGSYTLTGVAGNYSIDAIKKGFTNVTDPSSVDIKNLNISSFTLQLFPDNETGAIIKGYAQNELHHYINVYSVYSNTSIQTASRSGLYYSVPADFGNNHVSASAPDYQNVYSIVSVSRAVTYYNFTLPSINPFDASSGQVTETISQENSSLMSVYLGNNTSSPDYGVTKVTQITGFVKGNGSSANMANQKLEVITSVNGTYFIEDISTNSLGQYSFNMSFPGAYNFSIINPLSLPINFSANLSGGSFNQNLNFSLKSGSIEKLNIHTIGENNKTLPGVKVNITSGLNSNGSSIYSNTTSGSGNTSLNLTNGNYTVHLSKPGFNNVSYNLPPGSSKVNLSLTPVSSIGSNFTTWNQTEGLPGESPANIASQMNNSKLPAPSTVNYNATYFTLLLENGTKPLSNQETAVYIYVNGYYYILKSQTNSSGELKISLKFGGTYTVLPETVDFNGTAISVNTTIPGFKGSVVRDSMNEKKLFNLDVTLQNPYSYPGSAPPAKGLSVSGYILPIIPATVSSVDNVTYVNYTIPGGHFYFAYSYVHFVPVNFSVDLTSNTDVKKTVDPFLVILSYNDAASLTIQISGPSDYNEILAGVGTLYLNESPGSITSQSYLSGILTNTTTRTLTSSSSVLALSVSSDNNTAPISGGSSQITYTGASNFTYYNFTLSGTGRNIFLNSINYGVSQMDIPANFTLFDNSTRLNGTVAPGSNGNTIVLSKYFTIIPGSENHFRLKYYDPGSLAVYKPSITINYTVVSLNGVLK